MQIFAFSFDDNETSGLVRAAGAAAAFDALGTKAATVYPLPKSVVWPDSTDASVWIERKATTPRQY